MGRSKGSCSNIIMTENLGLSRLLARELLEEVAAVAPASAHIKCRCSSTSVPGLDTSAGFQKIGATVFEFGLRESWMSTAHNDDGKLCKYQH